MIRIIVVDDLKNIVDYFQTILNHEPDMEVVGTASSKEEAVALTRRLKPDVVLMDIQMETGTAGIEAIEQIRTFDNDVKIVVLTIHEQDELLFRAYTAGAMDYIVKTSSIIRILNSIRSSYENTLMLRSEVATKILREYNKVMLRQTDLAQAFKLVSRLTNSEFEVLQAAYGGKKHREIAQERFVEEGTIKVQVNRILKKFDMPRLSDVLRFLRKVDFFAIYK